MELQVDKMNVDELEDRIIEILASCLSDNDVRPRAKEIFDVFNEAGYMNVELPPWE